MIVCTSLKTTCNPATMHVVMMMLMKQILTAVLNRGSGEDAAEEGQSNAVQQPGAEDKDGCFPVYTLQYISSGEQQARHVPTHRT